MKSVNMENTVIGNSANRKSNTFETSHKNKAQKMSFFQSLKTTPAFVHPLKDYSFFMKIVILLLRLITFVFYVVFWVFKLLFSFIAFLCSKSKAVKVAFILIAVIAIIALIDFCVFYGKIYPGVHVGDVDLSNKTIEEAKQIIDEEFSPRLSGNTVVIYVNEEARQQGTEGQSGSGLSEQLSVEQAKKTIQYWKINSVELDAGFPAEDIANEAINSTRGVENIFKRLSAMLFGQTIKPYANYNQQALNNQIDKINETIGQKTVNPTVVINDGVASALPGSDGNEIVNNEFYDQLNNAFFQKEELNCNFVVNLVHSDQKISLSTAQDMATKLNYLINKKVNFSYKNQTWESDKLMLSKWIKVDLEEREDNNKSGCSCSAFKNNFCLTANINEDVAANDMFYHTKDHNKNNINYSVHFENIDNNIIVHPEGNAEMPNVSEAINALNEKWLGYPVVYEDNKRNNNNDNNTENSEAINIDIISQNIPKEINLNDAINLGIVSKISSFTTTYSSGSGTENRNHNIALASNTIDNSICKSDGGTWSFNSLVGECSEKDGYKEAGTIVGNTYSKSIGGGVCQVATTVFNSVYEAGYDIIARSNHNLYIASYPAGKDAAISYPGPDLKWLNNTSSDVLVKVSANGYLVDCSLYGVNPQYTVVTEASDWTNGDPYTTEYVVDPAKPANSKQVQTSGADGRSIVVTRIVYDKNGNLISKKEFPSIYKPKTEIIVLGPGDEANKMLLEKTARMKKPTDNW